jgi:hypothetical protein
MARIKPYKNEDPANLIKKTPSHKMNILQMRKTASSNDSEGGGNKKQIERRDLESHVFMNESRLYIIKVC